MLPRLLYLSDVPVESSYHGSALVYRLLQRYPADRLRVVEGNLIPARTDRRLPSVEHATLAVGRPRLLHSRFHDIYSRWLLAGAGRRASRVPALIGGFTPDAVMTVAHGFTWRTAAVLARRIGVPLHLVVHDDWPRVVAPSLREAVDRAFGDVYRQAATRFCVSPHMAEEYERRYGVRGTVLLPTRAMDAPVFAGVAERLHRSHARSAFAFAGTINTPGYARLIRQLTAAVRRQGGEVLLFGPITADDLRAADINPEGLRLGGLLNAQDLAHRLRQDADVLFAPMSFAEGDRENMRMGFPSKLADYTAVGLPLLIAGPPDCSAVRWARSRPGTAEVVTSEDPASLDAAVARLSHDPALRLALAAAAQQAGQDDFSAAVGHRLLAEALGETA